MKRGEVEESKKCDLRLRIRKEAGSGACAGVESAFWSVANKVFYKLGQRRVVSSIANIREGDMRTVASKLNEQRG